MTENKHTPGPWKPCRYHEGFDGPHFEIEEDERLEYQSRPFVSIEASDGTAVAYSSDLFKYESANAYLIAASPDLLAALEKAVERQGFTNDELIAARQVIAKAKGQA